MAFRFGGLVISSLLFIVAFASLLNVHRVHARNVTSSSSRHAAHSTARTNTLVIHKQRRPKFGPGMWRQAHATFYEGGSGSFGGACGYEDVVKDGYGLDTAAVSTVLFNQGQGCGACYEIKCVSSPKGCKAGESSILVTATNLCPDGGWCSTPKEHFDLAKPAYLKIAEYKAGIVPIEYRRVPCKRQGGIKFTITGNPYFNLVKVWNVGGAGDVAGVQVKGNDKLKWTELKRNWGQKWETNAKLVGESLTFRVRASDGRYSTAWHVAPKNWQFGQTFEGKNFT